MAFHSRPRRHITSPSSSNSSSLLFFLPPSLSAVVAPALSKHEKMCISSALFPLGVLSLFLSSATADGSWTQVSSLPFGRSDASASAIGGTIYIAGGCDGSQDCSGDFCSCTSLTKDFAAYNVLTNSWSRLPSIPAQRYRHEACSWRDSMYLLGGRNISGDAMVRRIDVFNTTRGTWSTLSSTYPEDLGSDNTCVTVGDTIFVMGECYAHRCAMTGRTGSMLPASRRLCGE